MPLETMIRAVLERDGKDSSASTVVALHCQQMREWGTRGGSLEFRPIQDDPKNHRLKFINRQHSINRLSSRLNYVMDAFTARGEICWFFLPKPNSPGDYIIDFFVGGLNNPDPEYKCFYKPGGRELEKVIIVYSYDQDTPLQGGNKKRWVTIEIDAFKIKQSESIAKPSFDQFQHNLRNQVYGAFGKSEQQVYDNPFAPELPVKISKNNARRIGQQGTDDFFWIKSLIEEYEELIDKAHSNLKRFSNPSLITTRSASEVLENSRGTIPQTWASANRYVDNTGSIDSGSTNPQDSPSWDTSRTYGGFISTSSGSIADIIGGVSDGERFGYIQADAVSGDQNLWIKQIRELIHWIIGGIDPLGVSSSITFAESRTLFGRVQNTADLKAQSLYREGLCEVYEQCVLHEEKLFKKWLFGVLKNNFSGQFEKLVDPSQLSDEQCQKIAELAKEGVIDLPAPEGLLPFGDRTINWRFTREVYQMTTREILDLSISARNDREDGVSQETVLRRQFPWMSDQEIRNAMSGFSPRVVGAASGAIQQLLQMYSAFMGMPDPDPGVRAGLAKGEEPPPWGLRLGLPELLDQALFTLKKEISYGKPLYEPADPPTENSLAAIAAQLQPYLDSGINSNEQSRLLSATADAYGIPELSAILASYLGSHRSDGKSSVAAGSLAQQSIYPSAGATVSADPRGRNNSSYSGEYGTISALQPTEFRPPIPGNGVDPIWYNFLP